MKSRKKRILGILFSLALMVGMICAMSQAVYAGGYAETWGENQTIDTSRSINGLVGVSNDITLRIADGATLTVNGSIAANGKTLTVKGPGKLVVNGAGGNNGISGNINVKGADIEITGKPGSDATQAGSDGTDGGWAVYGNVVVYDGSIKAIGGNGGNGAGDGSGGYGGFGIYGDLTVTGGSARVHGGNGGSGTVPGNTEKAVSGTLVEVEGTVYEESDNAVDYTPVSSASKKQFVLATGPKPVNVKLDVGAGHADQFGSEMLTILENAVDPCDVSISDNVITFTGVRASMTETGLWSIITGALNEKGFSSTIDDNELWFGVGFRSFDKYATLDDFSADINAESHEAFVSEGFPLYLLWKMPYTKLDIDNGNPICGKKSGECQPKMPDGFEEWYEGYTWTDQDEEPVEHFKGDNEYIYYNEYKLEDDGVLWKYFINPEDFSVSIKGGEDLGSGADVEDEYFSYDEIIVTFKAKADHDWDAGKVTKKPTTKAKGVKTFTCKVEGCGATKTEDIPKLKPTPKPAKVSGMLLAKATAKGKTGMTYSWNKVKGAAGYDIFFAKCNNGETYKCKKIKTIKGNKTFKWTKKGLKKGAAYKGYVKAFVYKNGKKSYVKTSPMIHTYTGNVKGKHTNAKSLKVNKTKVTLKKGKSFKVKAKVIKVKKNKTLMEKSHVKTVRYMTSNKKVATVSKSGKIKAKGKGKCTIVAFAHNGVSKTIKVTVK